VFSTATKTTKNVSPFRVGAKAPTPCFCGSTQISDRTASIIHHTEYMPYGETFLELKYQSPTPYKFNAKEKDEETDLYYYGARYYSPELSIWGSVDPLADHTNQIGLSPYAAFWNNPIRFNDPDGMCPECEENIKNPIVGESTYISSGNILYSYDKGGWTQEGGTLPTVAITRSSLENNSSNTSLIDNIVAWTRWGQSIKDFLNIFQGKGSDGGSRGGRMLSTKEKNVNPQGPAIKTNGDIGNNAYTNVDNFPTLNAAKNSGGIIGVFSNIANAFTIGEKFVGNIQNMSSNKSEGSFDIQTTNGWHSHERYTSSIDSAKKQNKYNENPNIKNVVVYPKSE